MDEVREIPGYKVILRTVLKSQIQYLVEQLAAHAEEESMLLTANITDGTSSHLGSDGGKVFLSNHDDLKQQFLGFCMKRQKQDSDIKPACTESGLLNIQSSRSESSKPQSAQKHSKKLSKSRHVPYAVSHHQENRPSSGQGQAEIRVKDFVFEKSTSSSESAENNCNTRSSLERESTHSEVKSSQDEHCFRTCSTNDAKVHIALHEIKQEPCDPDDESTCKGSQHANNQMLDKNTAANENCDETDGNPRVNEMKSHNMDKDKPNDKCDAQKTQNQRAVESVYSNNSKSISNEKNKTVPDDLQERKSRQTETYKNSDETDNRSNAEKLHDEQTDKNIHGEREDMEVADTDNSINDYLSEENSMTEEDGDPPILDKFDCNEKNDELKLLQLELETNDSLDTVNYSEDNGLELHFSGSEEENIDVGTEAQNTAKVVKEVDSACQESREDKNGNKCLETGNVMEVCVETMNSMTSCVARAISEERKDRANNVELKPHADDGKNSEKSSEKDDILGNEGSCDDSQDKTDNVLAFLNEIARSANDDCKVLCDLIAEKLSESDSSLACRQTSETQTDEEEKQSKSNKDIAETNKRISMNKGQTNSINNTASHPVIGTSTMSNSLDDTSRNSVNKHKKETVKKVSNSLNSASSETEKDKGNKPIVIDLVDTESKSVASHNKSSSSNTAQAAQKIQNSPRQVNSNKTTNNSQQGTPAKQNFIDDLISKGVPIIIRDEDDDIIPMPSSRFSALEMNTQQYVDQLEERSPGRIKHFQMRQGFSPSNVAVRQQLSTSQQPLSHYQQSLTYQDQHFTQTQQKQYHPDPKFTQSQQNQYVEDQQLLLSQQHQYMSQQQTAGTSQQYYTPQQFSSPLRKQLFTPPKNVGPLANRAALTSGRGRGRGRPKLKPSTTQSPIHGMSPNMTSVAPNTRGVSPSAQPFSPPHTPTTPDSGSYLNLKQGFVTPTKQQQQSLQENAAQRQVHLHHQTSAAQKQVIVSSLPATGVKDRTNIIIEDKQRKSSTETFLPQQQNLSAPRSAVSHLQHLQNMSNMVSKPVQNMTPQVLQAPFTQSTEANLPVISNVTSIAQQSSLDDQSGVKDMPTQQVQQIVYIPMLVSNSDMQVIQQANEQTPVKRAREPELFTSPTRQFSEPALKRQNTSVSDGSSQLKQQHVIETGTQCKSPPPETVSPEGQLSPSKVQPKLEIDVDDVAILTELCIGQMTALTSPTTNSSYESSLNSNSSSNVPLSSEKPGVLQSQQLARSELKSFSPPMSPSTRRLHAGPGRRSRNSSSEGSSASSTSSSTAKTKSKNFGCGDCGKSFASKQALNVHFKKHTQDRPFECDVCGKHFSQKGYLKKHIHSHFQEKQQ